MALDKAPHKCMIPTNTDSYVDNTTSVLLHLATSFLCSFSYLSLVGPSFSAAALEGRRQPAGGGHVSGEVRAEKAGEGLHQLLDGQHRAAQQERVGPEPPPPAPSSPPEQLQLPRDEGREQRHRVGTKGLERELVSPFHATAGTFISPETVPAGRRGSTR